MLLGRPLFPGSSTLDQIEKIMNVIQTPQKEDLEYLPSHLATNLTMHSSSPESKTSLREMLSSAPQDALNLLEKLLVFNPNKRPTADEALRHPYVARKSRNRTGGACECKTSGSSTCDYEIIPQSNVTKSNIKTVNTKYGGVVQKDFKEKSRNSSRTRNVSIMKANGKPESYPAPLKPKYEGDYNEPVKVTVVSKNFEKPKSRTWDLFNGKKIPRDKYLISKDSEIQNKSSHDRNKPTSANQQRTEESQDTKYLNTNQNRSKYNVVILSV
ncbi:putative serine/threonine-protein kinase [Armadillidium nasatum]|uniref:Putative serine/threonine-protein kinase n=1 Tax=Armadillidium nasatum TaxID=96803 RepID=A0A5N5SSK9_9CRUS|nr:putative serine/threonine-protein kinase [Armadillidium nasatum]